MIPRLLIVDDDSGHRTMLRTLLSEWGFALAEAENETDAIDVVRTETIDIVLLDIRMTETDDIATIRRIRSLHSALPILILTPHASLARAREALKAGAYDYLIQPVDPGELQLALDRVLDHTRLAEENHRLRTQREALSKPDSPTGTHSLSEIESVAISATLERTGGNKSEAARILGITRATLHAKLKKYAISS